MDRRKLMQSGLASVIAGPLLGAVQKARWSSAAKVLTDAVAQQQVSAAALYVKHERETFARAFGAAGSPDDRFLLASISKPMSVASLMVLYDRGEFQLDDPVKKFLPEFKGGARAKVTIRHLLSHVSGLPDQLPENRKLREKHAPLPMFVTRAMRTPLLFTPGSQYRYSSMGILLASEIAHRMSGMRFADWIEKSLFRKLEMKQSALGLGRFKVKETMRCQVERAAPESGSGDPQAKDWDWNSHYWRALGSPWGGVHASAPDVARFLADFLEPSGRVLKPATARLMLRNHNPPGLTPRGLGFGIGRAVAGDQCSPKTFGHSGATGTLAWADPATDTLCVVLTTLPGRAANPHPRQLASEQVAAAVREPPNQ